MSIETTPRIVPPSRPPRDGQGRIIASDVDWAERVERLAELFARYEAEPVDEPAGLDAEIMRGIDEGRPHRPLFQGLY